MSRGFGDEWSYDPGWVDSTPAADTSTPTTGIPYYLARDDSGTVSTTATAQSEGSSTSVKDWFGMGKDVVGTFVDIFGRPVSSPAQYPPVAPQSGIPIWGWALIGVGAVAVVGFTVRSLRKPRYAGRRRHARR